MKRLFSILSVATVVFALAGCQEKNVEPFEPENEGSTFELFADIIQTKTTLDGLKVDWDADDVLYMVTPGNDAWSAAQSFTYDNGKFVTNSTLDEEGEYTINAIYCSQSQSSYHKSTGTTHKLLSTQSQNGRTTTHIQENDALVGQFDVTIPMVEAASVEMAHIYTMMEVDVKNNTGAEIDIVKFEMTASDADLAGVFTVSFDTPGVTYKSSSSETITVNVTDGTVAQDGSFPVYFVMAPLSDYSGDVTFRVTDADSKTYTKTVSLNNKSFLAGKYNTTSYTISAADVDPEGASVTWDLSVNKSHTAGNDLVTWTSDYANMSIAKGSSQTDANAYLASSDPHTRIYKGHVLSVTPADGYAIKKVVYTAVSTNYQSYMVNSKWTNAAIDSEDVIITAISLNGKEISTLIGTATRLTSVKVYYVPENEFVEPTLTDIEVSGQRTEFLSNETFEFDGKVEAIYDEYRADVTDDAEFSVSDTEPGAVLVEGKHDVTVTYSEFNKVYTIVVNASEDVETIVLSAATKPHNNFPEGSTGSSSSATYTIDGYDWTFCPSVRYSWYTSGYILWGKEGGYILLPSVEDKRLQSVKILTGTGASTAVQVAVYDEKGEQVVSGGEAKILNAKGAEFSWALTGTDVNTKYQLRVVSDHNAQLQTLTCIYSN